MKMEKGGAAAPPFFRSRLFENLGQKGHGFRQMPRVQTGVVHNQRVGIIRMRNSGVF